MSVWCLEDWNIGPIGTASKEAALYEQVISSLESVLAMYKQHLEMEMEATLEDFYNVAKDSKTTSELLATRDNWSPEDAEEIAEINGWSDASERFAERKLRIHDVEQEITKYKIKLVWSKSESIATERAIFWSTHHSEIMETESPSFKFTVYDPAEKQRLDECKKRYDEYTKELTDLQNQLEQLISQYADYDDCLLSESDKQWFSTY